MELMQPAPPTARPVNVSAPAAALINMLMIQIAHLIQPIAQAPVVRAAFAVALKPTALLTVVIPAVIMVTAAAGSAVSRKPVVLLIAIAMPACVIVP